MSAPDSSKVQPIKGELILTPTDLTAAFPYGGTQIGSVRDHVFHAGPQYRGIHAEELGVEVEHILTGEPTIFACVLRDYDDDALAKVWPQTTAPTGATASAGVLIESAPGIAGKKRPGQVMSDFEVKLLFAPKATETHYHILIYRAIPLIEESAQIEFGPNVEPGLAVMWKAIPHKTKGTWQQARKERLTL